jgi:polysaccharide deacetylase 2 family uncharacterized protein YibQ
VAADGGFGRVKGRVSIRIPALFSGWRGLGRFWLLVLLVLGIGGGVLEVLGAPPVMHVAMAPAVVAPAVVAPAPVVAKPVVPADEAPRSPLADPALEERDRYVLGQYLPRIGPHGLTPMHAYAAKFEAGGTQPKVAILVAGIGMNAAESAAVVDGLPAAVSLAVSPYAIDVTQLLLAARKAGHEYLLSIPMEPTGFPVDDTDSRHTLLTNLPPAENLTRLHWVMGRLAGYVGMTSVMGQMRGQRLESVPEQLDPLLHDLADRGLLFVDGRPGAAPLAAAWNRAVDVVLDEDPVDAATVDQHLDALARIAQQKGAALGVVTVPRPVTLERVGLWIKTLSARGLVLAPASALVQPPAQQEQTK